MGWKVGGRKKETLTLPGPLKPDPEQRGAGRQDCRAATCVSNKLAAAQTQ